MKNDPAAYKALLDKLNLKKQKKLKRQDMIWSMFSRPKKARLEEEKKSDAEEREDQNEANKENVPVKQQKAREQQSLESTSSDKNTGWKQEELQSKIAQCTLEIEAMKTLISGANPRLGDRTALKAKLKKREELVKALKRCRTVAKAQRKHRLKVKRALETVKPVRSIPGRPALEESEKFKGLPDLILRVAQQYGAADPKRRAELLSLPKTLDDLQMELAKEGLEVKRSTLYMRLVPRRKDSRYGKRHVRVVPVQLRKPQYDGRKQHVSARFCFATGRMIRELASWLGPKWCIFISPDDKATCPMGIPAATKQGKVLMHLDYKLKLPDHQYVVASRHKLKPSVYALCVIDPSLVGFPDAVQYTGPTAIRIRSCKHDKSTSRTHLRDLKLLLSGIDCGTEWRKLVVSSDGKTRPVVILRPDGGPDQNPRHQKNQDALGNLFISQDLDCLIVALYPEGFSAFNPVERRMAPLSRELCGVIFDQQHYGCHLNSKKETTDIELEKRNFAHAGTALADLWNTMPEKNRGIGGYDVNARWVEPDVEEKQPLIPPISEEWKVRHMLRSRYFVMWKKCDDISCCTPCRSPIKNRLPSGFLPAPRVFTHNADGDLSLADPKDVDKSVKFASLSNILAQPIQQDLPFDTYNNKVDMNQVRCPFCSITLCSPAEVKRHRRAMHFGRRAPGVDSFEIGELDELEDIVEVIDKNGDEYLCVMEDEEDMEWRRLPPSHPLISRYQSERQRLLEGVSDGPIVIPQAELGEFMASIYEDI